MPIRAECESCGKVLNAKDDAAGRRIKCPDCGEPISVPGGRRKKGARKKSARRRPEPEGEPDLSNLDFGRLAAMERRGESLGQGTIEECVSCGEPVGDLTEECPHCGEPHVELKRIKKGAARRKAAAQNTVIVEDKRDFEKMARRDGHRGRKSAGSNSGDTSGDGLTAGDWVICIIFSGIGPILGIVRMAKGESRGWKMLVISIISDVAKAGVFFATRQD
jgi:predicted RNA-binding Zn-ribbon protein involved in translation (DUF1610 family)